MVDLIPGHFYWVRPVFDVDFTPPGFNHQDDCFEESWNHWWNKEQPALFIGYDEVGEEKFVYLGQHQDLNNYWPVCWVGNEITWLK